MDLGKKLYLLRKDKGFSQAELAHALSVSRQAVSRWECGTSLPSTGNLLSLSRLYGVDVEVLTNDGVQLPAGEEYIEKGYVEEEHIAAVQPAGGPSGSRKAVRLAVWTVCVCILCAAICIPIVWAIAKNQTEEVDTDIDVVQFEDMNKDPAFIPSDKHFELGPW